MRRPRAGGRRRVRLRGSHVVVAVPLGVLKRGAIGFAPGLPRPSARRWPRVGFGAVEKVAMVFDAPFWHDLTHTHIVFLSDHAPLELPMWIDLNGRTRSRRSSRSSGGPFARTWAL